MERTFGVKSAMNISTQASMPLAIPFMYKITYPAPFLNGGLEIQGCANNNERRKLRGSPRSSAHCY